MPPLAVLLCLTLAGCQFFSTDEQLPPGASADSEPGRPLEDLELPVCLRTGDPAPTGAAQLEATTKELRVDGRRVIGLDNAGVAEGDRQGEVIPALVSALSAGRSTLAMRLHAAQPYETTALILSSARKAGLTDAAFQVRKTGESTETGWLVAKQFAMTSRADDMPPITAVKTKPWEAFTNVWQQVYEGCRSAASRNCAYVNSNIAAGGTLKIELMTSGRGINVNFFRRGVTQEQKADEARWRAQQLAAKKEDFLQGRISREDMEELLLLGDPATVALFQFRNIEGLSGPSALGRTMGPVCHQEPCGVVIAGDRFSQLVRVVTMIGAAFPDGTVAPFMAFEKPWTEKPKYVPPEWESPED